MVVPFSLKKKVLISDSVVYHLARKQQTAAMYNRINKMTGTFSNAIGIASRVLNVK